MKCPNCENELRRDKKNPNYGLCDICRKKYNWIEQSDDDNALFRSENKLKTFNSDGSITISIKAAGKYDIIVNDSCIKFTAKGALNFFNKGMVGEKVIPFKNITAVQFKKAGAITSGYIQFIQFGSEVKGGLSNAIQDENSIVFSGGNEEKCMYELKCYIERKINHNVMSNNSSAIDSTVPVNAHTGADEIRGYKELLDEGIITRDEFEQKKRQILGI
jgi:hypothetical protein